MSAESASQLPKLTYQPHTVSSAKGLMLVGRCLQDGVGVPQDESAAVETYLAAASTHTEAQLQLGISYQVSPARRPNACAHTRPLFPCPPATNLNSPPFHSLDLSLSMRHALRDRL